MTEIILLVTWFVGGQTPESYQVTFGSRAACETAAQALKAEATALASAGQTYVDERLAPGGIAPGLPARASAICVARQ